MLKTVHGIEWEIHVSEEDQTLKEKKIRRGKENVKPTINKIRNTDEHVSGMKDYKR